jgi:rod shape-determining protein MreD
MVRAALAPSRRRIGKGPLRVAAFVPAATVIAASFLSALPIVSTSGWYPDFGFLVFTSWRLLRSDPWPAWWAAPLGLVNDLFTGYPIGFSIALWSATMLALDLIDRRTMWRDYWIEWVLAAVLLAMDQWLQWRVAAIVGARVAFAMMLPPLVIAICIFPFSAWLVSRIDAWRLGR